MKKILSIVIIALIFAVMLIPAVSADDNYYIYDMAGLLDTDEASEVDSALSSVSAQYGVDVVILTFDNYETFFSEYYEQSFYYIDDAAEYVCKNLLDNTNNVILMVSMSGRDWCIASNEKGHDAFTAYGREYIGDIVQEDLSDAQYKDAFMKFAQLSDEFLAEAEKGTPYDTDHKKMDIFDYFVSFGVPLVVGAIISLVVVMGIRSKYKPVRLKAEANDYLINGSLQLHQQYDHFLYTNVSRTRKSKSSSSSSHDSGSFGSTSGKF